MLKNLSRVFISLLIISIFFVFFYSSVQKDKGEISQKYFAVLGTGQSSNTKLVLEYKRDVLEAVQNSQPLKLSASELDSKSQLAQDIALKDEVFLADIKDPETGSILHSDIMKVYQGATGKCQKDSCYKVEKYNFVSNTTTVATVDIKSQTVVDVQSFKGMQGDISFRLKKMAQEIAINSKEVKEELGYNPRSKEATMANVKTSLTGSTCDRSNHLCVAPTFLDYDTDQALWAIIDLTDLKLVGAKWTDLGEGAEADIISEANLQNRHIMENFCQKDNIYEKGDWEFTYRLTNSDGLEVKDAYFKGEKVLDSAKIVDWHVSYAESDKKIVEQNQTSQQIELEENSTGQFSFGYSDATGCPMFSTSSVIPFNGPEFGEIKEDGKASGFSILQDFRNPSWPKACNYRYQNKFEFYNDGSFRVSGINHGRGCGASGWYRPVFRIDLATSTNPDEVFSQYMGGEWQKWNNEGYYLEKENQELDQGKYLFKLQNQNGKGFYIEPNFGQFEDGAKADNAFSYLTLKKEGEGEEDLVTIGPCCNTDYEQGPEKFMEDPEDTGKGELVFWYVPQIKNSDKEGEEYCWAQTIINDSGNAEVKTWPCTVGPKLIPIR